MISTINWVPAKAHNIPKHRLIKINNWDKKTKLANGDIVFLESKKRKCNHDFHITKKGENILTISQKYGVKTKLVAKRNKVKINYTPQNIIFSIFIIN